MTIPVEIFKCPLCIKTIKLQSLLYKLNSLYWIFCHVNMVYVVFRHHLKYNINKNASPTLNKDPLHKMNLAICKELLRLIRYLSVMPNICATFLCIL